MKKESKVVIIGLMLSMMLSMMPMVMRVSAPAVVGPISPTPEVEWIDYNAYLTLAWNPEYLKVKTGSETQFETNTTIIVQGKDTYGQNVEAKVLLNGTHKKPIPFEKEFILNDTHTDPPMPVAFAEITGIFQQNGSHCNSLEVRIEPEPFQEYLGEYHIGGGYKPGVYSWGSHFNPYWMGRGDDKAPKRQDVPVEPSNPDPIKIVVNWEDSDNDLFPDDSEIGTAVHNAIGADALRIEGLDEKGNILIVSVDVPAGSSIVYVVPVPDHTWSTICKITGGKDDSYYIFTHPRPNQVPLFKYRLRIDHITIHPDCYDILAWPGEYPELSGNYPGVTNITIALRDKDGNLIHWNDEDKDIIVNFATSGGKIQPSCDIRMKQSNVIAKANLTADTNARTIRVTASANVPATPPFHMSDLDLFAWTELTFDGVNSVFTGGVWPVHTMMWGYTDRLGIPYTFPVPPKPWLPPELGGPVQNGIKLDGPVYEIIIPLYVGCNLISSPVHPLLCGKYYTGYPDPIPGAGAALPPINIDNKGIPMDLLFGKTSACDCIEAIWWYDAPSGAPDYPAIGGTWHVYVPSVSDEPTAYFRDGVGYWIKAEKPCTLEFSGIFMENGPFTPPTYVIQENTWTLMGVTSLSGIGIDAYLESVSGSSSIKAAGPVWVYYAKFGTWVRNPAWGLWPGEAFWIYNKVPADQYIAP